MSGRYGVPHAMSKNKIARDLVSFLPPAENFVDLFGGGGAVSHAALESGKYSRVIYNDVDGATVRFFADAFAGKYATGGRVIDRATFWQLKDEDPYVRYIWSFGSKGDSYIWGRSIEKIKLAICQWIADPTPESRADFLHKFRVATGEELTAEEVQYIEDGPDRTTRRLRYKEKVRGHYPRKVTDLEPLERLDGLRRLEKLKRLHKLERIEPLERLGRLGPAKTDATLTVTSRDYREVEIPPDSVIYCDIPYEGSVVNAEMNMGGFDFPAFYDWTRGKSNLFISSYDLPRDRFELIWEKDRRSIMSSTDNTTTVHERLFKPRDVAS